MNGRFWDDALRRGASKLSTLYSAQRIVLHLHASGLSAEPTSRGSDYCAIHERQLWRAVAQHRCASQRAGLDRMRLFVKRSPRSEKSAEPTYPGSECCAVDERQLQRADAQHPDMTRRAARGRFRRRQEGREAANRCERAHGFPCSRTRETIRPMRTSP